VEVWTWKLAKMLTMQGQQAVFPYPAWAGCWRKCCANSPFPAAGPKFGWWEGPLWIRRGLAAYEIWPRRPLIRSMHITAEGRNIFYNLSDMTPFPHRSQDKQKRGRYLLIYFVQHRHAGGCTTTAAMSHELGSPRGFCHRPGIARLRVGANGSEEQTDLDFGLERCGEIWSLKHLVCVIGHLVHRVVPVEWRHSNVGRVCRGKANHNSKEFLNQCSIIALAS
jgi:hypothetical protein